MNAPSLAHFGLAMHGAAVPPEHRCFRPPSWPPPRDWVTSEDQNGNVVSRWGDEVWDFSPWAKYTFKIRFTIRGRRISEANADLLRLVSTWLVWGVRAIQRPTGLGPPLTLVRQIVGLCEDNGIQADQLMRFPRVWKQLPSVISPATFKASIGLLHRLWDARRDLGFSLVDPVGIKYLLQAMPQHERVQTPCIPPRIWSYQVRRLRLCLDDYLQHRAQIESCFDFCLEAYSHNFGSLTEAFTRSKCGAFEHLLPFQEPPKDPTAKARGRKYHGAFELTAARLGIRELMLRWIPEPAEGLTIKQFATFLSLVQFAAIAYIANFTLQRKNEVGKLRADCLEWEDLPVGRLPVVCGETTKTDRDSDARWPTSPSVEVAVDAMRSVAQLRMKAMVAHPVMRPDEDDRLNPYLFDRGTEPWSLGRADASPYHVRPRVQAYKAYLERFPRLFNEREIRITEEDLQIARALTPNLAEDDFTVGKPWPFGFHQLRRTGAVNMFASGLLSDSSVQFLMKHRTLMMAAYYGRGHTRLRYSAQVGNEMVTTMYETMAEQLVSALSDRYVSPLGQERKQAIVVNVIGQRDLRKLAEAGARGEVSFREVRLGACTKLGDCEYGGIESVARCGGGDGAGPCADALFDRDKRPSIELQIEQLRLRMAATTDDARRQRSLLAELRAMENYLDVIRG